LKIKGKKYQKKKWKILYLIPSREILEQSDSPAGHSNG
jgi:hypothetical protein